VSQSSSTSSATQGQRQRSLQVKLYPHQQKAWDSKKRFVVLCGGTGAGKTFYAPKWVYKQMAKPEAFGMAIGTAYKRHVANLMVPTLTKFLDSIECQWRYVEDKGLLTLPYFGSKMIFGSADNPNNLEGPHVDFGWMDEAGLMSRLAWDVLRRRTGACSGQILITTIPYFRGWLMTDCYEPWVNGTDEGLVEWIKCSSSDNPEYSREEIEYQRKHMRPDKFAIYYLGEWAKPAGLVFPTDITEPALVDLAKEFAWNDCECCRGSIPHEWPAYAGHDWGFNAPTTGVWGRLSPDDVLYIVADYQLAGLTIEEHVDEWKMAGLNEVDGAFGDPASPEQWLRAANCGYPIEKADNSISSGIDAITDRLKSGRLKVSRECQNVIDCFDSYVWAESKDNDQEFLDKPAKPQPAEHVMDGLRYLVVSVAQISLQPTKTVVDSRTRNVA